MSDRAGRRRRGPGAVAVLVLAGGLVAACSSSPSTTTSTTRPKRTTTTTTSTTGPARSTTTGAAGSGTTTTAAGLVRCPTTGLTGRVTGESGAAGTTEVTIALQDGAAGTCQLTGYPGLQLLGGGGTNLPTVVQRMGNYPFTAMAPTTVVLTGGQSAYFNIGYSDVPVGGETSCPTSTSMEVTPPDATDHLVVPAALAPCGGGKLVVSPVFAAGGAASQTTAPPSG